MTRTMDAQRWIDFMAGDVTLHATETIDDFAADAISPDWKGGPVEAIVPELVPEFAAISARLAAAYDREDDSRRRRLYAKTTPALFRLGCTFGDFMEAIQDAREAGNNQAERDAMDQLRGVWACIVAFADDYQ